MNRQLSRLASPVMALCLGLTGCATSASHFFPIGEQRYEAKSVDYPITVYTDALPEQPYRRIARLNFHSEKTVFASTAYQDALIALKQQARQAGADAIIELKETRKTLNETKIYNVTATAIVYTTNSP